MRPMHASTGFMVPVCHAALESSMLDQGAFSSLVLGRHAAGVFNQPH